MCLRTARQTCPSVAAVPSVPLAPSAPTVSAVSGQIDRLSVSWTVPPDGGAAITDYNVRYCRGAAAACTTDASFTEHVFTGTSMSTTITMQDAATEHQVQVRATNAEGAGPWSASGSGSTETPMLTAEFVGGSIIRNVAEGDAVELTVRLSGAPGRQVAIPLSTRERRGASSSDYTGVPSSLTFGATETERSFTVTAVDDSEIDIEENVIVEFGTPAPSGIVLPESDAADPASRREIVLVDNDFLYQASYQPSRSYSAGEASGVLTVTVRLRTPQDINLRDLSALNETVTVSVSSTDGTATAGEDYTALSGLTLNFVPTDFIADDSPVLEYALAEKTVTVSITDDAVNEGATPETFTLALSHESGQRVEYVPASGGETATVSITDDDGDPPSAPLAPTVSAVSGEIDRLSVSWTAPLEGDSAITDYDVRYCRGAATACTTDADFTEHAFTGTVTATTIAMLMAATEYQVQVRATNAGGAGPWSASGSGSTETPMLTAGLVGDVTNVLLAEGDELELTVRLSGAPGRQVAIPLDDRGRFGASSSDYTGVPSSLTFGATETERSFTVTAVDDSEIDIGKSVVVAFGTPAPPGIVLPPSNGVGPASRRDINLVDNDFLYQASYQPSRSYSAGEASGALTVTVRLRTPHGIELAGLSALNETVTVSVSSTDGTATAGEDYTALSGLSLIFAPTDFMADDSLIFDYAVAEKTVTVSITDDAIYDGATPETFTLVLSHDSGQRVEYVPASGGETATVSITDDDDPPSAPLAPTVSAVSGTSDRLSVSWTAPSDGGSAITDYDVRYCRGTATACTTDANFTEHAFTGTATATTIAMLMEGSEYQVQVRASNGPGTGSWSASGAGTTTAAPPPAERILVSNAGQSEDELVDFSLNDIAQGFRTGMSSAGYVLSALELLLAVKNADEDAAPMINLTVTLRNASGNDPSSTVLATFMNPDPPASFDAEQRFRFTLSEGVELDPNTPYFIHLHNDNPDDFVEAVITASDAQDLGGLTDWGIDDSGREFDPAKLPSPGWQDRLFSTFADDYDGAVNIRLDGYAKPVAPVLITAPVLSTAEVNGDELVLTYGEALDATSVPAAAAFTVTAGGAAVSVSTVSVSGMAVTLGLASAVTAGQTVLLDYVVPSSNPLQNGPGIAAGALVGQAVVNRTLPPDLVWTSAVTIGNLSAASEHSGYNADAAFMFNMNTLAVGGSLTDDDFEYSGSTYTVKALFATTVAVNFVVDPAGLPDTLTLELASAEGTWTIALIDKLSNSTPTRWIVAGGDFTSATGDLNEFLGLGKVATVCLRQTAATNACPAASYGDPPSAPSVPSTPTVSAVSGQSDRLSVSWTAPSDGGSAITDYDVQYCQGSATTCTADADFTGHAFTGTATATTIAMLMASTEHQVQVRARNAEGAGPWSASGAGTTAAPAGRFLVSNTGRRSRAASLDSQDQAQGFETGMTPDGYVLSSLELLLLSESSATMSNLTVTLRNASGDDPGVMVLATFENPDSPALLLSRQTFRFTLSEGVELDPNTRYYIHLSNNHSSDGLGLALTASDDQDPGGLDDWGIDDTGKELTIDGWRDDIDSQAIQIRLDGDAKTPAPVLSTAEVNGDELVLTYGEALDTTSVPAAAAFTVTAGGAAVSVSTVSVSGMAVTLGLASAVTAGQTVLLDYVVPSSNPLQNGSGSDVSALAGQAVLNQTPVPTDLVWTSAVAIGNLDGTREEINGYNGDATRRLDNTTLAVGGSLTDDDFEYSGSTYTVEALFVSSQVVSFEVDTAGLPDTLTLELAYAAGTWTIAFNDKDQFVSTLTRWSIERARFTAIGEITSDNFGMGKVATVCLRPTTATQACPAASYIDAPPVPSAPSTPTVSAVSGRIDRLAVSWTAPANTGSPITDYDVRYCGAAACTANADFTGHAFTGTVTATTIAMLMAATEYQVQVRAINAEGAGPWSASGAGTTVAAPVRAGRVLVSNTAQTRLTVDFGTIDHAQGFETGSISDGYVLSALELILSRPFSSSATMSNLTVTLRNASGTDPGSMILATFENPDSPALSAAQQTFRFILPEDEELDPNTRYFIHLNNNHASDGIFMGMTSDDFQVPSSWGIDDNLRQFLSSSWQDRILNGSTLAISLQLHGYAKTPPVLSTAEVNGDELVLTYGEVLDATSVPAAAAFTVTVGGATVSVSSVSVSGMAVTLGLASAVTAGQTVLLDYVVPSSNPLQNRLNQCCTAGALAGQAVENQTPEAALVWTSTVTIGGLDGAGEVNGYTDAMLAIGSTALEVRGSLADNEFEYSGSTYTVKALFITTEAIYFEVTPAGLPDTLTLELGNAASTWTIAFSDKTPATSTSTRWVFDSRTVTGFTNPIAGYQVGKLAEVCLRPTAATNACPPLDYDDPPTPLAPSAPSAPTVSALSAMSREDGRLAVSWTAPANPGSPITDYDVRYCPGTAEVCRRRFELTSVTDFTGHDFTGTSTSTTISMLRTSTEYHVQVRATNAEGTGPWSAAEAGTTAAAQVLAERSLVSNLDQLLGLAADFGQNDFAQGFMTGNTPDDYVLSALELSLSRLSSSSVTIGNLTVTLRNASTDGNPGEMVLATFTNPDSPALSGTGKRFIFTLSEEVILNPNTRYFIHLDNNHLTDSLKMRTTNSRDEDSGSLHDWEIDDIAKRFVSGAWEDFSAQAISLQIRLDGYARTPATLSGLTVSSGGTNFPLDPAFASGARVYVYAAQVPAATATVTVVPTATDTGAVVTVAPVDVASATSGHQVALAAGDNAVTVQVTAADKLATAYTVTVNRNRAPVFTVSARSLTVAEDVATDADLTGGTFTATDADGDTVEYALSGTDASAFVLRAAAGSAHLRAVALDHEAAPSHVLTVTASDGRGGSAQASMTVSVTDVDEPPSAPLPPTVSFVDGTIDSLAVSWTAPANTGPPITDYDVRYCRGAATACTTGGDFTEPPFSGTATATTIAMLMASSEYQVQVRATNAEGTGPWSESGSGSTGTPMLTAEFIGGSEVEYVAEGDEVKLTVRLSGAPGRQVAIPLSTRELNLVESADYTGVPSSLTFEATETERSFTVTVVDDSELEIDRGERIVIGFDRVMMQPLGIGLPDVGDIGADRIILLVDNDFLYQASYQPSRSYSAGEASGALTVTVRLRTPEFVQLEELEALNETVTVSVSSTDGTATAGEDYTVLSGLTLTFARPDFMADDSPILRHALAEKTVTVSITDDAIYDGATPETFTLTLSHDSDQRVEYVPASEGETATVSITDDDGPPMPRLVADAVLVSEGDADLEVALTVEMPGSRYAAAKALTLDFSGTAQESTSTVPADYSVSVRSVMIAANSMADVAAGVVTVRNDEMDEDQETIVVQLLDGVTVLSSATITVADNDGRGVTVSPTALRFAEGAQGSYAMSLTSEPTAAVTVALTVGDTELLTTLPTVSSSSLEFTAANWNQAQTVTVTAPEDNDSVHEIATISHAVSGGDYEGETAASVTVAVEDNDRPSTRVDLSVSPATVTEGAGVVAVVVTARLDGAALKGDLEVELSGAAGASTEASDYTVAGLSGLTVTIAAQAMSGTAMFQLTAVDDDLYETGETFVVQGEVQSGPQNLGRMGEADLVGTRTEATVELASDDAIPVLSFTADRTELSEQDDAQTPVDERAAVLVLSIDNGVGFEQEQTVALEFGTPAGARAAVRDTDYTDDASGDALTLGAGVVGASATVTVTAADDAVDEDDGTAGLDDEDERLSVTATHGGAVVGTLDLAILDDDHPAVTVNFSAMEYTAMEGGAVAMVAVELEVPPGNTGPERQLVIPLTQSIAGGAASDYTGVPSLLTFGATETERSFTVTAVDDAVDDDGGTVQLGFGVPLPAQVSEGTQAMARVVLVDNDTRGVTVSPTALTVAEGAEGIYTVSLGSQPSASVTVTLSGSDSVTAQPAELVFTASDYGARTVTVRAAQDLDANDESVAITHAVSGGDYAGETAAGVTVEVQDDDEPSTKVTLSLSDETVTEGGGARAVTVTGQLDGVPEAQDVTVALTAAPGTASMDDYTAAAVTLIIAAGQLEATAAFTVTPVDDRVDEEDETLTLSGTLSSAQGLAVEPAALTVTIADDDTRGVTVSVTALAVDERQRATYTVGLDSAPTGSVTVALSVAGEPTVRVSPESLVFTAQDYGAKTVTVSARGDADELDGAAVVSHAVLGADYGANGVTAVAVAVSVTDTGTVTADIGLTLDDASPLPEGGGPRRLVATVELLSGERASALLVPVTVAGGTAEEGRDFQASPSRFTVRIPAGATSRTATFTLTPVDDGLDEDDETVLVRAQAPANLEADEGVALTIADDDTRGVTVSPTALAVDERQRATYTVALDSAPTGSVTVALSVAGEPTVRVSPESLVFTAQDYGAKTVTVSARGDADELDGAAVVSHAVSGADYGANGVTAAAVAVSVTDTGTVTADIGLTLDDASPLPEGGGPRRLVATVELLSGERTSALLVPVTVGGGTAEEGSDFQASPSQFTVRIPAGATSRTATFTLTPVDDGLDEGDETVLVARAGAGGPGGGRGRDADHRGRRHARGDGGANRAGGGRAAAGDVHGGAGQRADRVGDGGAVGGGGADGAGVTGVAGVHGAGLRREDGDGVGARRCR